MKKYITIIENINGALAEFNKYIKDEYKIEELDIREIENDAYFLNIREKRWGDFSFPRNRDVGGVYFYFGYNLENPDHVAIYIGKASYSRKIGHRLWSHFRKMDEGKNEHQNLFIKNGFVIELITSLPFENEGTLCLASSLEEHLIRSVRGDNISLFNSIGNY